MQDQPVKVRPGESRRDIWLLAAVLAVLFVATIGVASWEQARQGREQALASAKRYTDMLAEFRTVYTSEVVTTVIQEMDGHSGMEVTHDYRERDGAIPLPATLSMELGRRITERGNATVSLYSPFPFPWRTDGGLRDDFGRDAWAALNADPKTPYYRVVQASGQTTLP